MGSSLLQLRQLQALSVSLSLPDHIRASTPTVCIRIDIHEPALSRDAGHGCHRIGAEVEGDFRGAIVGFNQGEAVRTGVRAILGRRDSPIPGGVRSRFVAFDLVPFWAVAEGWSKAIYFTSI